MHTTELETTVTIERVVKISLDRNTLAALIYAIYQAGFITREAPSGIARQALELADAFLAEAQKGAK